MTRIEHNEKGKGESGEEMNHEYEYLCDNIISLTSKNGKNVVGITSTRSAEGCTTIATTLAQTMARKGSSVLLMDGNFRDPLLHEIYQTDNENGLKEMIHGEVDIDAGIKNTALRHLKIITSGCEPIDPSLVYSSTKFFKILGNVKKRFDIIIVDLPPIIPYTGVKVVFQHLDAIILVIQAEQESYELLKKIKNQIEESGGTILGAVLNRKRYYVPEFLYKRL